MILNHNHNKFIQIYKLLIQEVEENKHYLRKILLFFKRTYESVNKTHYNHLLETSYYQMLILKVTIKTICKK